MPPVARRTLALPCLGPALLCVASVATAPATAHPHVFVDAHVRFHVDGEGRLDRVAVRWVLDDFYSMVLLTEMGLDPVARPDAEGRAALAALLPDWVRDYGGAGTLEGPGGDLPMAAPAGAAADLVDGRIEMRFDRPLDPPLAVDEAGPLTLWLYDPLAFVAYLVETVTAEGPARCDARLLPFEADALGLRAQQQLAALGREEVVDDPGVGRLLADRAVLSCR